MEPNPLDARPLSPLNPKDAEEIVYLLNKAPSSNVSTQTLEDKDDLKRVFKEENISQPNLGSNDTEMISNIDGMVRSRTEDDLMANETEDNFYMPPPIRRRRNPNSQLQLDLPSGGRRKKRGGWKRNWYLKRNEEPYYECPKKEPPREWRYKEGIKISDDSVKPPQEAQELIIEEMEDTENSRDPMLVMNHTKNPHRQSFTHSADDMCNANFKPLKKNDKMEGSGRKKKTRKKKKIKSLSTSDYKKILKFYKLSIPKKRKTLKKKAEKIIAKKFCSCIKKVAKKFKQEGIAIGICSKSVVGNKGLKRGKFRCKKSRKIRLYKGGKRGLKKRTRRK